MNFRQIVAKYFSGNLPATQLPKTSLLAFDEGYDSPSLWILAGLNEYDDSFEIEGYLRSSLEELGITIPSKRKAALEYADALANEIIAGERDVAAGVREICERAFANFDFRAENKQYVYDGIFFHHVYGAYHAYDDLEAEHGWRKDSNTIDLISNAKVELFEELKKWHEVVQPYVVTII